MAFWRDSKLEPLRKYRFQVYIEESVWWAKTVEQPSPDVSMGEYQLINHKIKYPGLVSWNDIVVTIVDVGEKGMGLFNKLRGYGYNLTDDAKPDGMQKNQYKDLDIYIKKLDSEGGTLEVWTLFNAFIKSIQYSQLDYADDGLVDISLTLCYDSAFLDKDTKTLNSIKSPSTGVTGIAERDESDTVDTRTTESP